MEYGELDSKRIARNITRRNGGYVFHGWNFPDTAQRRCRRWEHHDPANMSSSEKMIALYSHLSAHKYHEEPYLQIGSLSFYWTNHHLAILVSAAVVFLAFGWLAFCRKKDMRPLGPLQTCSKPCHFVRDDMVYSMMGKEHGRRFVPLFLSQFFCILLMNLMGILPNFDFFRNLHLPTTATANLAVTAGLALVTFSVMLYAGMKEQGFGHFWVGLAPPVELGDGAGMSLMRKAILGILYPIEILGLIIKPVALTIRLFANMTGGHLAMLTVYGLIYLFQNYMLATVGVAFNVFLTFLEVLVAFIQAYVFTYLSIIFVSASVHPEH